MKSMTKLGRLSLLLLVLLIVPLVLAACGGDDDDDDNGDSDSLASPVENAEQFLEAIFIEGDADAAKSAACGDIYDEVDTLVALVAESEDAESVSSISCERDGSTVSCTADGEGEPTTLTVDGNNRVCGGEIIDFASSMNDPSAEESSENMIPTMSLPTAAPSE